MAIQRIVSPFRRLQWKLTFSYTLITVATIFVIEILFISIAFIYVGANETQLFASNTASQAKQAAPYFSQGKPNAMSLTAFLRGLETANTNPVFSSPSVFLTIVDAQGHVIASVGTRVTPSDAALQAQLSAQDEANLQTALSHNTGANSLSHRNSDMIGTTVASIVGDDSRIQGALLERRILPNIWQLYLSILPFLPRTLVPLTLFAAIPGAIFGFINARGLTRRLRKLSLTADAWSQGDFSVVAHDASGDELGQMTRRFNTMAEQLQNLLETRQQLATLEERNRLARDLHDSVKQQIFAISMQVGAVKVLLNRDPDAAKKRLDETDVLVRQAQQELTTLIKELRPVALEGKGLVEAIHELMTQWMQQTGILVKLQVEGQQTLPLTVEEALFRVVQEALSNVARHSKATLVQMKLSMTENTVTLTLDDNGQGFDSTQQREGVGLLSMRERMKALGGDVRVESSPSKGTHVVAYCERLGVPKKDSIGEVRV
jgi:NarL family two-component system sensor histidine kinase LiaS